jgi:hypothetical protein
MRSRFAAKSDFPYGTAFSVGVVYLAAVNV